MIKETIYNAFTKIGTVEKRDVLEFLYRHVENCYSSREDVKRVVEYAIKDLASFGGFVLALKEEEKLVGIAVVNQTGMEGASPKNVLVQIATDKRHTDGDLLKKLVERVMSQTNGDLGLQITSDNPAIAYFENLGFRTDFVVMRLQRPQGSQRRVLRQYRKITSGS